MERSCDRRYLNAMNKKILRDIILVVSLVLIAVIVPLVVNSAKTDGQVVEVRVNGELFGTYSLKTEQTVDIGGLCQLEISGGEAKIVSAVCRKHLCIAHAPISHGGETTVCLPSGVSVRVLGDEYDFVS